GREIGKGGWEWFEDLGLGRHGDRELRAGRGQAERLAIEGVDDRVGHDVALLGAGHRDLAGPGRALGGREDTNRLGGPVWKAGDANGDAGLQVGDGALALLLDPSAPRYLALLR